jgi:hypothetical protein
MTTAVPPRVVLSTLDAATLAAAVESCRSWRQVLVKLGLSPNRHARRLRDRCDEWNIDYSHFRYHVFTDEQLVEVLGSAATWAEALSRLGYTADSGSARATIRKHARRLGLPAPEFAVGPVATGGTISLTPLRSQLRSAGPMLIATTCLLAGHRISWPLEPAPYDLLVDTGAERLRVQVKTCTRLMGGSWNCSVTRSEYAGGASGKRRAWYSPDEIDVFAIIDGDGQIYWIPIGDIIGQTSLSLRRYGAYRVGAYGDLHDVELSAPDLRCRGDRI